MKRNNFLDVLKGICILLVILTHFEWTTSEHLKYFFPFWMNPAIPIFMIISGYVYSESYKRKSISTFAQAYSLKNILDRIIRYTIPLILIYIIEIPLKILIYQTPLNIGQIFHQFLGGGWGPGNYYYPCMLQFIFLFPLIFFAVKKWDFAGLLLCGAANIFYEVIKVYIGITNREYRLIVLRYLLAIALGCYFSSGKFKIKKWMGILSFLFGAAFLYAISYCGYRSTYFSRWSKTSMPAALYIAPIIYLLIKKCTWECKPLALLGKASYNIYLVQMVFFYMANHIFDGVKGRLSSMLFTYVVCLVLGVIFYKIETPITQRVITWNTRLFDHHPTYKTIG